MYIPITWWCQSNTFTPSIHHLKLHLQLFMCLSFNKTCALPPSLLSLSRRSPVVTYQTGCRHRLLMQTLLPLAPAAACCCRLAAAAGVVPHHIAPAAAVAAIAAAVGQALLSMLLGACCCCRQDKVGLYCCCVTRAEQSGAAAVAAGV